MAASMMAMMSSTSALGLGSMQLAGGSKVNLNTRTWSVARAPAFVARRGVIRCEAGDNYGGPGVKEAEEIKKITPELVENGQPQKVSEKKPLPGVEGRLEDAPVANVSALRQAVDQASKKEITPEMIEKNQAKNTSEKKSVFGAEPSSGAPYPRSEMERRPETGSTSIGSILAFDGAGPETINGRLAMLGLVWAFFAEKVSGLTVWEQLYTTAGGFGLLNYVILVQLITFASLVPFVNGESTDARSFGPFRAQAERWNGRLAMLGFLSLVLTEQYIHAPVFASGFATIGKFLGIGSQACL